MKILKIIGLTILALVILVVLVGVFSPRNVVVERSITINASAESVFEEVNGMKVFNAWSPWQKIDPEGTTYTYEGPETGVGSKMSWNSEHPEVGSGSQEIVAMEENSKVRTELYFGGYEDPNYAELQIKPGDENTTVTWTFEGDMGSNPIGKIFGLFMDSMLGPAYEEGLKNLKAIVEAKPTFEVKIGVEEVNPIAYLGMTESFDMNEMDAIGPRMGEIYGQLVAHAQANNIQITGKPFSIYLSQSETQWDTELAIPIQEGQYPTTDNISQGTTPGGKVVKAIHMGDYYKLGDTHKEIARFMEHKKLTSSGYPYEVYVTDPMSVPDTAKWMTEVYYPVN